MDSSVQLITEELYLSDKAADPLELAILSGSMLILLGDENTIAPKLAAILSGRSSPVSGRVLIGEQHLDVMSHSARGLTAYVSASSSFPDSVTVSRYLELAAAAAGFSRKNSEEILSQLYNWCSLTDYMDTPVEDLSADLRFITGFAAACLPVPKVLILQGPFPVDLHPLLEDLCDSNCAVVASVPGLEYIPQSSQRIALCSKKSVTHIIRFQELADACSSLMRVRVLFFPALPRSVMESLKGAKNITAVEGGYQFNHSNLSAAVTNLANLARANSRQIAGLEIRSPSSEELMDFFSEDEDPGEVDLFCGEDLDI